MISGDVAPVAKASTDNTRKNIVSGTKEATEKQEIATAMDTEVAGDDARTRSSDAMKFVTSTDIIKEVNVDECKNLHNNEDDDVINHNDDDDDDDDDDSLYDDGDDDNDDGSEQHPGGKKI
ncbi:hypothetical protein L1987_12139 [Smallanthus sonchifolius]|uniref:Uncharacterized protein n=1 Tax=Smallanthus sonchifolius TaxID=185202 RepID=A0ACB9JCX9_9ASTR|nr:hypothetical protein L1987_12139 [Smallanthus sonchifolius]